MGSEMCIRDRVSVLMRDSKVLTLPSFSTGLMAMTSIIRVKSSTCLLYTSDAADERSSVDLGGRRIIKKKHNGVRERSRRHKREASKVITTVE